MIEGDWLHKLADNALTALAAAAAGIFGTLLSRASKKDVTELIARVAKLETGLQDHHAEFVRLDTKLSAMSEDLKNIRRLLEKRRDTDE